KSKRSGTCRARSAQSLDQPIELRLRVVLDFDAPSAGARGDADSGPEVSGQLLGQGADVDVACRAGRRALCRPLAPCRCEALGGALRQLPRDHLARKVDLLLRVLERQNRPGMAGRELAPLELRLHRVGEGQEAERVRDGRATLAQALRDLFLSQAV